MGDGGAVYIADTTTLSRSPIAFRDWQLLDLAL
jgi:hypothetical protein